MDAKSLQVLRNALALSTSEMAWVIGLEGSNAADKVREMERNRPISGPIQKLLGYLSQAVPQDAREHGPWPQHVLPTWMRCGDLEDRDAATQILMHTRWPRFYGWVTKDLEAQLARQLAQANTPIIQLSPEAGHLVVFFIDQPPNEPRDLFAQAIRHAETLASQNAS